MNDQWRDRFHDLARCVSKWSKDPSTKVGAVVVEPEKRIVYGLGFNGFPRGVDDCATRYENRDIKYPMVVHAECNAIINARSDVSGCHLICTLYPCNECAKYIVQSGIVHVCCPDPNHADYRRYRESCKWDITDKIFEEAGIDRSWINEKNS